MNKKIRYADFAASVDRRLSGLQEDPWLAQRIMAGETDRRTVRKLPVSVLAACALAVISMSVALAVGNLLPGIFDLSGVNRNEDTENMVQHVSCRWETEYATATVREMLYDGQSVYIAGDVEKKDRDDILLIPAVDKKQTIQGAAGNLGKDDVKAGETIAQYAERNGMSVVYFSFVAQSPDGTFWSTVMPGEVTVTGEDSWAFALCFPALETAEEIRVTMNTTVYDSPLRQSALPLYSPERPLAVPHSITVHVSDVQNVSEEKTVMEASSVTVESALKGLTLDQARLIRTPIGTYLDLKIGNPEQTDYAIVRAEITPLGIPDLGQVSRKHFGSPLQHAEGFVSGAREIELYTDENFTCRLFHVDLVVSPMKTAEELTAYNIQFLKAGSLTVTFGDEEN